MYNAIFEGTGAVNLRQFLLEDPQGQELIRGLETRGIVVRLHYASGQRDDGTPFTTLDLDICHPQRPLNDEERGLVGRFIPPPSFI